jgi:hypothetical protein
MLHPLGLIVVAGCSWLGGLLLARHAFRLKPDERLLAGAGIGMATFVVGANLLGHLLPAEFAFWGAGVLVLLGGLASGIRAGRMFEVGDLRPWRQLIALAAIAVLVTLIARGLGIFDDRKNLSIVSTMASGDIPPRFYMNGIAYFRYHYGSQLLAAALMRLGGLFPWSALDAAKGVMAALTAGLAYLMGVRLTHSRSGGMALALVALFASGSRYLLLALPQGLLREISDVLALQGSAVDSADSLIQGLRSAWIVEGGPPTAIPFAYVSGVLQPFSISMHSPAIGMSRALLALFVLLGGRTRGGRGVISLGLILAAWALAWETDFLLAGVGSAALAGALWFRKPRQPAYRLALRLLGAFALAGVLAIVQGGTLTEIVRLLPESLQAGTATASSPFALRLPPAFVSAQLGELSLVELLATHQVLLLAALAEAGLALMVAPLVTWWSLRWGRRGRTAEAALAMGAIVGFVLPFVVRYESDRDITRLTAFALITWALLGAAALWILVRRNRRRPLVRTLAIVWAAALILPGVFALGALLTSLGRPMIAEDFSLQDARMAQAHWDTLEPDSWVLHSHPWRAVVLFGRLTHSTSVDKQPLDEWIALVDDLDPAAAAAAGYSYIYMDQAWWEKLSEAEQRPFQSGCPVLVGALDDNGRNADRWLWDIRGCRAGVSPGG